MPSAIWLQVCFQAFGDCCVLFCSKDFGARRPSYGATRDATCNLVQACSQASYCTPARKCCNVSGFPTFSQEYQASQDVEEARRRLRELALPFFHHEAVKQALLAGMQVRCRLLLRMKDTRQNWQAACVCMQVSCLWTGWPSAAVLPYLAHCSVNPSVASFGHMLLV